MEESADGANVFEVARHHRAVLDSLGEGVVVQDTEGRVLFLNALAADILDVAAAADAIGRTSADLGWAPRDESGRAIAREDRPGSVSLRRGAPVEGMVVQYERPDGEHRWLEMSAYPLTSADVPDAVVTVVRDISERVAAEAAREADRQRLEEAQRIGGLGSYQLDLTTGELVYSKALYELLGIDPDATATVDLYRSLTHPEDAAAVEEAIERAVEQRLPTEIEHRLILRDGTVRWVRSQATAVDDGTKVAGVVLDVTARREAETALAHGALHDALTGLANRTLLESRLVEAAARGGPDGGSVVAVLAIGIDHLGIVNEELGHEAGDDLLVQVAQRLTDLAGPDDTVARLAADEFVVVREGTDGSWGPARLARSVQRSMAEPFEIRGRSVFITVSIGAVEVGPGPEPARAVRLAMDAMARAKGRGRAQTFVAEADLATHPSGNRLDTASALRRAIDGDELRVHYQPVIELGTGRIGGFEALVRWQHPERGLLQPGQFIEIAEDTGLILELGRWVLGEAIGQVARWRADGPEPGLSIAVNVSARQLRTADVLVDLREHLEGQGLPADAVHLELTESVLMDDVEYSIESLVALKSIGVQIDVDDFGTGFSSLNYLKRLPIDGLKIDQSFVAGLGIDKNDSAITHAIVSLAQALDLSVIAEGVETEDQARQLVALGCQSAQGHLWSAALPPADALALIAGRPVGFAPLVGPRATT